MQSTVLIFSNCPLQTQAVRHIYDAAGFKSFQSNESTAKNALEEVKPDVVVIAPRNDEASLTELCQRVRSHSDVPIIVSPQFYNEHEELNNLAAGADDYVSRERSPRILLARTESLINRTASSKRLNSATLNLGILQVNLDTRTVTYGDVMIDMTRTEFDLLAIMLKNMHRVVHREELLNRVWGSWYGDDHILEVHISRLRRKIQKVGGPRLLHPVRGIGYRFLSHGQTVD